MQFSSLSISLVPLSLGFLSATAAAFSLTSHRRRLLSATKPPPLPHLSLVSPSTALSYSLAYPLGHPFLGPHYNHRASTTLSESTRRAALSSRAYREILQHHEPSPACRATTVITPSSPSDSISLHATKTTSSLSRFIPTTPNLPPAGSE